MQIKVGTKVEIKSNRLPNFSGFKGVVKAVEATMTENISRDENGGILMIEYPFKQNWEVYQVDIGNIVLDLDLAPGNIDVKTTTTCKRN